MSKSDKSSFRKFFFNGIRPTEWLGTDNIASASKIVKDTYKSVNGYSSADASKKDFLRDMQENGLSDEDVFIRMKRRRTMAFVYLIFAVVSLIYMGYLFMHGHSAAGWQAGAIGLVMLLFTVREHFVFYQLKMRSYKVKLSDWLSSLFRGEW